MTAFEPPARGPAEESASRGVAGRDTNDGAARSSVAVAVARLEGVHQLPLHEQPGVYQAVHTELQNALAAIDDA